MQKVLYTEEQRFKQWWLWLILVVAAIVSTVPIIYGIYSLEVLEKPWGNKPANAEVLMIILFFDIIVMGGIILMIYKMRLILEIRSDGIYFRYPPLSGKWKYIKMEDIERFEVIAYNPVFEYGGWGIKGSSRNKAFNVSGNTGLRLYLKNGKKVLIGTQQKRAIEYVMEKMMKGKNSNKNG